MKIKKITSTSEISEQPDDPYLARIDGGGRCKYEIIDGELVEHPVVDQVPSEVFRDRSP